MTSIVDKTVKIQTTSQSHFSTPAWFGEIVVISSYFQKHKVLTKINEQVCFAKTKSRTRTAGAVIRPGDRSAGK